MQANDYQEWTRTVAKYPSDQGINYTILGLVGEAGEVADKYKKVIRDHGGFLDDVQEEALVKEVSDVAWYLARLSDELGITLEDLFSLNFEKLMDRKKRGVLQGNGDDR